jgi:hypothetical protein
MTSSCVTFTHALTHTQYTQIAYTYNVVCYAYFICGTNIPSSSLKFCEVVEYFHCLRFPFVYDTRTILKI